MWHSLETARVERAFHRRAAALGFAACGFCVATAALATGNLLPNAGFNSDISGWASPSPVLTLAWNSLDARGSSGSGSLRILNGAPTDNGGYPEVIVCVPVTAGQVYHTGGSFLFPGGQALPGAMELNLRYSSDPSCNPETAVPGGAFAKLSPSPDAWQRIDTQPTTVPAGAIRAVVAFGFRKIGAGGSLVAYLDDAVLETTTAKCFTSDGLLETGNPLPILCLGSRFTVTASWTTGSASGSGRVVQLTNDTGYLWFFTPTNVEMVVKVLNGCALNSRYWVFAGGLTNVDVTMTATDLVSNHSKTYHSPGGQAFKPIQDTSALAACP